MSTPGNKFFLASLLLVVLLLTHLASFSQGYKEASLRDTSFVNNLNEKAKYYQQLNSDSSLYYAKLAHDESKKLHYIDGQAQGLINMGVYYQSKGKLAEAMASNQEAIGLVDEKENGIKATAYLGLAQIYKDMSGDKTKDYTDKGIDYSKMAYATFAALKDEAGMANSLSMSGILYRDKANLEDKPFYYDTAFAAFTKAISLVTHSGKGQNNLAKFYNNISQVYLEYWKDYKKALEYLFKAVAENERNNSVLGLTHNYGNISHTYIELKDNDKAILYGRKMLEAARKIKRPTRIYFSYKSIYAAFEAAKKYDSALHYHILATNLNDSLTNINRTNQVLDLQFKYETAKKELEIKDLNANNSSQKTRIIILILALTAAVAIAAGFIFLYRRVQRQKDELNQQSKRLELMMKELHHRVKNNLQIVSSLLSLQTYKSRDEQVISVLQESQQRVQAMSLIHQRLYKKDEFTQIKIREYITDLVGSLLSSFGYNSNNFEVKINITKEMLDIDQALPIGLILNEMVTNSFKYAYAGVDYPALNVSLSEDNKSIFLSVKDNGKGLDEVEWKQKNDSFGKQLIGALTRQLRAKQSIVVDHGTEFSLVIPKKIA